AGLRPNPTVSFAQQEEPGGTDSQTRVELQWPLDLFRRHGRVAVAEREVEATARAVADRERLLAADVRMKYGEVVAALRELAVVWPTPGSTALGAKVVQTSFCSVRICEWTPVFHNKASTAPAHWSVCGDSFTMSVAARWSRCHCETATRARLRRHRPCAW